MAVKKLALLVALVAIGGAIYYFESKKVSPVAPGGPAEEIQVRETVEDRGLVVAEKEKKYERAKEISSPDGFVNTPGITIRELIGKKVILVDFWTYSCINCQRTQPHLNAWYQKYRDEGLEIVGVHTPEFEFEKKYENVARETQKAGIKYPVVLDNDYSTWTSYRNRYWPRKYLIDIDGFIVYDHIGEGAYEETEAKIRELIQERNEVLGLKNNMPEITSRTPETSGVDFSKIGSPETYFGAARNTNLGNGAPRATGVQSLTLPGAIKPNTLYLEGEWNFNEEFATNRTRGAKIVFKYRAKSVYFVARARTPVTITVLQDGMPVKDAAGGDANREGNAIIHEERLYRLIEDASYGEHTLEIKIEGAELDAFTFTFG